MNSELIWLASGIIIGFLLLMFWRDYRSAKTSTLHHYTLSKEDVEKDLWNRIGLYSDNGDETSTSANHDESQASSPVSDAESR